MTKIEFLDLGKQPITNNFLDTQNPKNEFFYDLKVVFDQESKLVSLKNFVPPPSPVDFNSVPSKSLAIVMLALPLETEIPVPAVIPTEVTVPSVKVAKDKSPQITWEDVPAPAIFKVPDDVIGEPVMVNASPVSVNATLVTVPELVANAIQDPPSPYFTTLLVVS
mgnify:CR=1 FL=1